MQPTFRLALLSGLLLSSTSLHAEPAGSICASPAQPVREQGYVAINGIEQWITVTGAACGNPVILFIHGGPGNALSPYADAIYACWERHYTLVQWAGNGCAAQALVAAGTVLRHAASGG
ncbi:hypothetical protein CLU92_1332 [Janthinobacterium sp. 61]|uniref:hypothetical protein n=1 Tax=Janthinobacterium sp. 61 TaxID=2035209 RepID=UPI000C700F42|nr:hypothetical protein [Janthinobacterium sp. 61]PKV44007.1 hypothetical protein CLU92_1332 [Janthinobacterium sp. 61]